MALIRKPKPVETPGAQFAPGPTVKVYIAPNPKDHVVQVAGIGRIEHLSRVVICCDTDADPYVFIEYSDTAPNPDAVAGMTKTLYFPLWQTQFVGQLEIDYPQQQ